MARKKKQTINVKETEYYKYAKGVIDGSIVAGELVRLACKRFIDDLIISRVLLIVKRFIDIFSSFLLIHYNV